MKLNTKTIVLTGTEQEIRLSGQNCDIRNDGTDTVYASGEANITAGADGVMSLPAGQAVQIHDFGGVMYLLGTGSVQICGHDYQTPVFKCATTGGGSGTTDQTARDTINLHANNTDIHLTAEDVAELVSNENLLINSDFRRAINQRGQSEYTSGVYSIDGWKCGGSIKVEVADGYIDVIQNTSGGSTLTQYLEDPADFAGKDITISICCQLIEGNGTCAVAAYDTATEGGATDGAWTTKYITADDTIQVYSVTVPLVNGLNHLAMRPSAAGSKVRLYWVKLELGDRATQFVPPNAATELLKCQRRYQVRSTGDIDPIDLRPTMREITDIRQRGDGYYEYIAEL